MGFDNIFETACSSDHICQMSSETEPFYLFEKQSLPIYDVVDRSSEQAEEEEEQDSPPSTRRRRRVLQPPEDGEGPPEEDEGTSTEELSGEDGQDPTTTG